MKSEKQLIKEIDRAVQRNKTYQRIAKETGIHYRKVSKLAKKGKYTRGAFIRERERVIAMMTLAKQRPVDIAKELGISRQLVNHYLNNIIWEDYEEYNKLGLEL